MRAVEIPGGTAYFREDGVDSISTNAKNLLEAAGQAVRSNLEPDYPELFEVRPEETDEEREARVGNVDLQVTPKQALVLKEAREFTIVALLDHWTLDRPLPTIGSLTSAKYEDVYDALIDAVSGAKVPEDPDFSPAPLFLNDEGEATVPTGSSDTSTTTSDQDSEQSTDSTQTSLSDGGPTSGESSSLEQ